MEKRDVNVRASDLTWISPEGTLSSPKPSRANDVQHFDALLLTFYPWGCPFPDKEDIIPTPGSQAAQDALWPRKLLQG